MGAAEPQLSDQLTAYMRGSVTTLGELPAYADLPPVLWGAISMMASAPTPIGLHVGPRYLTLYNAAYARLLGAKHPTALGTPAAQIFPKVWREVEPLFASLYADRTPVIIKDRPLYIQTPSGPEVGYFDLSYAPLCNQTGGVEGLFCLLWESLRPTSCPVAQAANDPFARIIHGSDSAIISFDFDLKVLSWNKGAESLYGHSAQEMILHSLRPVLLPKGIGEEALSFFDRIRAGERIKEIEALHQHKDGGELLVSMALSPLFDGAGKMVGVSIIARDISEQKRAEKVQDHLLQEMKHRLKNVLTTVLALARQTFGPLDMPEYDVFKRRLITLAKVQDLLTLGAQDRILLPTLLAKVLAPYPIERFHLQGPEVALPHSSVVSVSLALHELCTNALKYGALSGPSGRVEIEWSIEEAFPPKVILLWREVGGPRVEPPKRRGFGTILIEDLLASDLGAETAINYAPEGVQFRAIFSLSDQAEPASS